MHFGLNFNASIESKFSSYNKDIIVNMDGVKLDLLAISERREKIEEITSSFTIVNKDLMKICQIMNHDMDLGLGKDTNATATLKMYPTFVRSKPTGKETGKFLALDLGGTNFRVLLIELKEDGSEHLESKIYEVPKEIMLGPGVELFDHIAHCLASFVRDNQLSLEVLPLGLTMSFPCRQVGLSSAILVNWTKGFNCSGTVGQDIAKMLHEAVDRRSDVKIDVVAVVNDSTGTLLSCAFKNRTCSIGIIIGTGFNACYMERLERVGTWNGPITDPKQVIINTEFGAFGDSGCINFLRTEYDDELDQTSINPGKQQFEKMMSGMYLGELTRIVLVKLTRAGLIFGGKGSEALFQRDRFYTKYISAIESDKGNYAHTKSVFDEMGLTAVAAEEDYYHVYHVCRAISHRAAYLAAAAITALINRVNKPHVTVAVDGSVYKHHPHFHHLMVEKCMELIHPGLKFDMMLSEDGSGRGAALAAAIASKETNR